MLNRQNGRMILESIENGPLIWPSIVENGVTRPKKYYELSATEALQADCDIKATNIILQGLPPKFNALCLKLETELQKDFVEKEICDKLFKRFTTLEKHCISLEVNTQLNQEIFQRDNSISNQSAPSFDQLFELNDLKAQSQEKDMVIKKLKERIKSLSRNMDKDKIKSDLEEIETINIELEHRVTKLFE
ncbi:hypothetical protein Tco_0843195 [Tanacetum coccineum]|uniref:Uncharacterized protein n=1 Tax=Tanacetum coccineum TaxID=301880 RepID=A0ABQ5B5D7_9ASTR